MKEKWVTFLGCLLHVRSWALLYNTLHTEVLAGAVTATEVLCVDGNEIQRGKNNSPKPHSQQSNGGALVLTTKPCDGSPTGFRGNTKSGWFKPRWWPSISPLFCTLIPTVVLMLVHALNNACLSSDRRCMSAGAQAGEWKPALGFSNRGDIIQGTGYTGDGRAEKRNGRGNDPGVSNTSTAWWLER